MLLFRSHSTYQFACQLIDVPLLKRSLTLWKDLQMYYATQVEKKEVVDVDKFTGPLLNLCGGIMIGHPDSEVVSGTLRSIKEHELSHRVLSSTEVRAEFPVFSLAEEEIGVWEENAGYVNPELCIETYLQIAQQHHAEVHFEEKLTSMQQEGEVVVLTTNKGQYRARKVVLTVGAWAPEMYGEAVAAQVPLHVERRVLFWFKPKLEEETQLAYFQVNTSSIGCKLLSDCFIIVLLL